MLKIANLSSLQRFITQPLFLTTASALGVLLLVVVAVGYLRAPVIPGDISRQVSFVMVYPQPRQSHAALDKQSYKYSQDLKQLSFTAKYAGRSLTFSEQTTPEQFNDIPQYYDKLLEKLNRYTTIENTVGKFFLTRPVEVKHQVAVATLKGTLLFIKSEGDDMTDDEWRTFLNSLEFQQGSAKL